MRQVKYFRMRVLILTHPPPGWKYIADDKVAI